MADSDPPRGEQGRKSRSAALAMNSMPNLAWQSRTHLFSRLDCMHCPCSAGHHNGSARVRSAHRAKRQIGLRAVHRSNGIARRPGLLFTWWWASRTATLFCAFSTETAGSV